MNRLLLTALLSLAACGGQAQKSSAAGDSLSERQRDSMLAKSRIPGASGRAASAVISTAASGSPPPSALLSTVRSARTS